MLSGYAGLAIALVVMLGLIGAAPFLKRRFLPRQAAEWDELPLRLVKKIAVGPRQGIGLLQVGERLLVVSLADGGTRLLADLDEIPTLTLPPRGVTAPDTSLHPEEVPAPPSIPERDWMSPIESFSRLESPSDREEAPRPSSKPRSSIGQMVRRMALAPLLFVFVAGVVEAGTAPVARPRLGGAMFGQPVGAGGESEAGTVEPDLLVNDVIVEGDSLSAPVPPLMDAATPDPDLPGQAVVVAGVSASSPAVPSPTVPPPPTRGPAPSNSLASIGPRVDLTVGEGSDELHLSGAVGLVVLIGAMTLLPALILLMTSFTRILIVLQFLRPAIGTQNAPPVQLLVALSLLLTGVVMNPVLQTVNREAVQPLMAGDIDQSEAWRRGVGPFRDFMLNNLDQRDLASFVELTRSETPIDSPEEVPIMTLASAFVTSELKTAFQMGFLIFIPFVMVDLIVSSVLMSLGMFMLPPLMVSLPFKLLLFVLADGWTLVVRNLVLSFR